MTMNFEKIDQWRNFFRSANASIFEIIENAIIVAAKDHPEEFIFQAGAIAEKVKLHWSTLFCGHDHNQITQPGKAKDGSLDDEAPNVDAKSRLIGNAFNLEVNGFKESRCDGNVDEAGMNQESKYSYSEVEAFLDQIDKERELVNKVLRIKEVLLDSHKESEETIFQLLKTLQSMDISVGIMKDTNVMRVVGALQQHRSEKIGQLANDLVKGWKNVMEEWMDSAKELEATGSSLVSDKEAGLPVPPMDGYEALFLSQTPIDLSKIFDGIDDDGNIQSWEDVVDPKCSSQHMENFNMLIKDDKDQAKQQEHVTVPIMPTSEHSNPETSTGKPQNQSSEWKITNENYFLEEADKKDKPLYHTMVQAKVETRKNKHPEEQQQAENAKKQCLQKLVAYTIPSNNEHGRARPQEQRLKEKMNNEADLHKNVDKVTMHSMPSTDQWAKDNFLDNVTMEEKLKASKKKLQENYQKAEQARNRRSIQIMELHELPQKRLGDRTRRKKKNHSRNLTSRRR